MVQFYSSIRTFLLSAVITCQFEELNGKNLSFSQKHIVFSANSTFFPIFICLYFVLVNYLSTLNKYWSHGNCLFIKCWFFLRSISINENNSLVTHHAFENRCKNNFFLLIENDFESRMANATVFNSQIVMNSVVFLFLAINYVQTSILLVSESVAIILERLWMLAINWFDVFMLTVWLVSLY